MLCAGVGSLDGHCYLGLLLEKRDPERLCCPGIYFPPSLGFGLGSGSWPHSAPQHLTVTITLPPVRLSRPEEDSSLTPLVGRRKANVLPNQYLCQNLEL